MTAGRKQYLEHVKSRHGEGASMLRVPFASGGSLQGDPAKIDAAEALALTRLALADRRADTAQGGGAAGP